MSRRRGRSPRVVDTNVPIVANGNGSRACAAACAAALYDIKQSGTLVIDDDDRILGEYRDNLTMAGQPGAGDSFVKWVHDNIGWLNLVRRVEITPLPGNPNDFEEFPTAADLTDFDLSDRKFVAVAIRCGGACPILNATDSDWWNFRVPLDREGVHVVFLCPELFH